MKITFKIAAISTLLAACGSAVADPIFSNVFAPPGSERDHGFILGQIYGGAWTAEGMDYSNGSLTARRVSDSGGNALTISASTAEEASDRFWNGVGPVTVTSHQRYAGDHTAIGWIDDASADPAFRLLAEASELNSTATFTPMGAFRFALQNHSQGQQVFTSDQGDNSPNQMVTYQILGRPEVGREWAVFWEDRPLFSSDQDYNDATFTLMSVPTPSTAVLAGLGCMAAFHRRRVNKK